jgi:hypothetical protein
MCLKRASGFLKTKFHRANRIKPLNTSHYSNIRPHLTNPAGPWQTTSGYIYYTRKVVGTRGNIVPPCPKIRARPARPPQTQVHMPIRE